MALNSKLEEIDEDSDNLCYGCKYAECDGNKIPCNSCIDWIDGYLTATNYENNSKPMIEY